MKYDLLPEVLLKDGNTVEIVYYLGKYSIIGFGGQEELISSDTIDDASLNNHIRGEQNESRTSIRGY